MMAAPRKYVPHRVGLMIVVAVAGHIWCVSSIMSNPAHYPNRRVVLYIYLLLSLLLSSPPFIIFSVTAKTRRLQETSRAHISPTETYNERNASRYDKILRKSCFVLTPFVMIITIIIFLRLKISVMCWPIYLYDVYCLTF